MSVPSANTRIGKYEIIDTINYGSQGKVYKARDSTTGKLFALKELFHSKENQLVAQKEYHIGTEVRGLSYFLIEYVDHLKNGKNNCLVMELCSGGDLHDIVETRKEHDAYFEEEEVWNILYQIANALSILHGRKIFHRDIKPMNILLSHDGYLKLGDFGVSKILKSETAVAQTNIGTPLFLPPEICKGLQYDASCDIWAFGVLLYYIMTFTYPFYSTNQFVIAEKVKNEPFPPITPGGRYSAQLILLVGSLLEKEPRSRPKAAQLCQLLQSFKPFPVHVKNEEEEEEKRKKKKKEEEENAAAAAAGNKEDEFADF